MLFLVTCSHPGMRTVNKQHGFNEDKFSNS
jgi:hypothetical protein